MHDSQNRTPIKFNNLRSLLNSMKSAQSTVETFNFRFNNVDCIVFLSIYEKKSERHKRHSEYIQKESPNFKAKLEFIDPTNVKNVIVAYATYYKVIFINISEFAKFFKLGWMGDGKGIQGGLERFYQSFETIPHEVNLIAKDEIHKKVIASRLYPENPNAIYCIGVKRNGLKRNGEPKERSERNSIRAGSLRYELFKIFRQHTNISFMFSSDERKQKTDEEIIANFNAAR